MRRLRKFQRGILAGGAQALSQADHLGILTRIGTNLSFPIPSHFGKILPLPPADGVL